MLIPLPEHQTVSLPASRLPARVGEELWQKYGQYVKVEFPSIKTRQQWQLTNQGYVGYLPLTPSYHFPLEAKIPLSNLFGMLEYAFDLKRFRFLDGLMSCQSLAEFYERLAVKLAEAILGRVRQGLYRAYQPQTAPLSSVRGRVQPSRQTTPLPLLCHYHEHTADLPDNQILFWTLHEILQQRATTHPSLERAYRALQGSITLKPYPAAACLARSYHRLNEDYALLHALCRFFLEHRGPHFATGEQAMGPFLVNMSHLYERFVAVWLSHQVTSPWQLTCQERVNLDKHGHTHFEIDLVLSDRTTGQTQCVLDTKYKQGLTSQDLEQVTAYAVAKQCPYAILIYPEKQPPTAPKQVGPIQVHNLAFDLRYPLETSGAQLWQNIQAIIKA